MKAIKLTRAIFIILFILTVIIMLSTILAVRITDNKGATPIFGLSFYSVLSGSMEPVIYPDDIIIVKAVKIGTQAPVYAVDDIIIYESFATESFGEKITHRIVEVTNDGRYITKGDGNAVIDTLPIYPSQILGKYVARIGGANKLIRFMKSTLGFILLIVFPAIILIVMETFNFLKLFRRYKSEQNLELEKQKEDMVLERALLEQARSRAESERLLAEKQKLETEKLLEELRELKEQLKVCKDESLEDINVYTQNEEKKKGKKK